jgi:plasmid maintenance system antidote protein VapI
MVMQRRSTISAEVEQLSLLPTRKPCPPPDLAYLVALPNFRRAMRYAMSLADMEPKQVYGPLGKDKATWSRIENGDMSLGADDLLHFCEVVGNDAALLWLNASQGYDIATMRKAQDDKDKRIEALEQQLAQAEQEKEIIARFVRETYK